MPTASEEIHARQQRYARVEREADATGRLIGVRRLKPSQQIALQELAPGLDGYTTIVDERTGAVINVPKSSPLIMAASVTEIDGVAVPFPQTRGQLNAILDRLDEEGLAAVAAALAKFSVDPEVKSVEAAAKN